jgi:hypothetical protein
MIRVVVEVEELFCIRYQSSSEWVVVSVCLLSDKRAEDEVLAPFSLVLTLTSGSFRSANASLI